MNSLYFYGFSSVVYSLVYSIIGFSLFYGIYSISFYCFWDICWPFGPHSDP